MNTENKQPIYPYVSYPAFKAFIKHLHETIITDQIDYTMMPTSMSGGVRAAVISALKSLGLVNAQGNPSSNLKNLVEAYDSKNWSNAVKDCILSSYSGLFGNIDLRKVTRKQIDDLFQETSAEMKEKYIRFFLSANKEAEIEYSPHLKIRKRGPAKRSKPMRIEDLEKPPQKEQDEEKTPTGMFDQPIPINSEKPSFIRIPMNITVSQAAMVKAVVGVIEALAQQNEANNN